MLTRTDYLKEPDRWKGTAEEKELIDFCVDYIKNKKDFHLKFSPIMADIWGGVHPNYGAKNLDLYYVFLSKKVLDVYNATHRKK